ncbi:hypothetical protein ASPVEDRAFT_394403 [Aspergillus versicolor CBS 583.65]|uniref:Uncharacterized protein n=1 Tax=Aspergillus versicolor CBS 583.65 TaxID=1036611 RepID=A0A1L9Q3S2_ASPVE|nr:uncharacterized protein ASPVEDRAFT_394403 [Aspergillus versicolor CBS 583.65]OJJ08372.1 hypothetical protein ASPVEDRAFT_394403 [Aspergillus versicolor CBS 583.65]
MGFRLHGGGHFTQPWFERDETAPATGIQDLKPDEYRCEARKLLLQRSRSDSTRRSWEQIGQQTPWIFAIEMSNSALCCSPAAGAESRESLCVQSCSCAVGTGSTSREHQVDRRRLIRAGNDRCDPQDICLKNGTSGAARVYQRLLPIIIPEETCFWGSHCGDCAVSLPRSPPLSLALNCIRQHCQGYRVVHLLLGFAIFLGALLLGI